MPVTPAKYRHVVRGDLIVSSAGIVMNLVLALLSAADRVLYGMKGRRDKKAIINRLAVGL